MAKPTAFRGKRTAPLLAAAGQQAADATTPTWDNVQGKPTTFPPDGHTHTPNEVGFTGVPVSVTGARNDPEQALKNLLQKLEDAGLITDTTTAI
jgi:hypothetical protein